MAQGNLKLKKKSAGRITKKQSQQKKAAPKIIAPQKKLLKTEAKIQKTHKAALISATEKLIASRVGHLEVVKGSRRQVEKQNKLKEQKKKSA